MHTKHKDPNIEINHNSLTKYVCNLSRRLSFTAHQHHNHLIVFWRLSIIGRGWMRSLLWLLTKSNVLLIPILLTYQFRHLATIAFLKKSFITHTLKTVNLTKTPNKNCHLETFLFKRQSYDSLQSTDRLFFYWL